MFSIQTLVSEVRNVFAMEKLFSTNGRLLILLGTCVVPKYKKGGWVGPMRVIERSVPLALNNCLRFFLLLDE